MFVVAKQLVMNKLDVTFVTLLLEVMLYQVSLQQLYINKEIQRRAPVREAYLEPSRTSTMEFFAKIVNG